MGSRKSKHPGLTLSQARKPQMSVARNLPMPNGSRNWSGRKRADTILGMFISCITSSSQDWIGCSFQLSNVVRLPRTRRLSAQTPFAIKTSCQLINASCVQLAQILNIQYWTRNIEGFLKNRRRNHLRYSIFLVHDSIFKLLHNLWFINWDFHFYLSIPSNRSPTK